MSTSAQELAVELAAAEDQPTGTRSAPEYRGGRRGRRSTARVVAMYVFLTLLVIALLIPFAWMLSSSLKRNSEVFSVPIQWIPTSFQWNNYVDIWTTIPLLTYLKNSAIVTLSVTFFQLLTGSFAAYGFSKVRFKGRDILFVAYIATIAIPWQAYMIPQFIMMQKLELTNTLQALILLQAFGAFGVFLMRQFYLSIPDELSEAARIDGLNEYRIWWRIMLPLSKPALASLALLTFVNTWNDFMGPFIYLTSNELWTVQVGLQSFIGQYANNAALLMTGSVISIFPILVIFLLGQRYFIEGIATSGLKG